MSSNTAYGLALAAVQERSGICPKRLFTIACGAPHRQSKHLSADTVLQRLKEAKLLEEIDIPGLGVCVCLTQGGKDDAHLRYRDTAARLVCESILLKAIRGWIRNLGIGSYEKVSLRDEGESLPMVGTFHWDLGAPSYLAPLAQGKPSGGLKPGFVVCDILLTDSPVSKHGIQAFLKKCETLRQLRNVGRCLQIFVAHRYSEPAFELAKKCRIIPATAESLFGEDVAKALIDLSQILSSAAGHTNPAVFQVLFDRLTARCPACAEMNRDRKKGNLTVFSNGPFHCHAFPNDKEHNSRIFALAGISHGWNLDREEKLRWRLERDRLHRERQEWDSLLRMARGKRSKIIGRFPWNAADVWGDSPQRVDGDLVRFSPIHFLSSLFPPEALLWTGNLHESGSNGRYANRWREWAGLRSLAVGERIGPMVTPAIWKPGTISRSADQVAQAPFVVLDFDGLDGVHPNGPDEMSRHLSDSLALIRWIREGLSWDLAAILWTGSKSLHAWFHSPPQRVLESLREAAVALGIDAGLIGRPEHPCRLPGQLHQKTGRRSRVLWLG